MTNTSLKAHALRLIRCHEEHDATGDQLKEAYQDAADEGFTKAALRAAIKIHRMDANKRAKHDSAQLDLEMYLSELEGRRGAAE